MWERSAESLGLDAPTRRDLSSFSLFSFEQTTLSRFNLLLFVECVWKKTQHNPFALFNVVTLAKNQLIFAQLMQAPQCSMLTT